MIKKYPEDFIVNEVITLNIKPGKYYYYKLWKKDYTTEQALEFLPVQRKDINHCGNKDKRAVTTQYISVHNKKIKDIDEENLKVTFLGTGTERLTLGSHEKNEFIITVRDIKAPKKKEKVMNYFGEQRFSHNNHLIGKAIVKGEFKEAISQILENNGEYERKVRGFIEKYPNNYVGALRLIPKKILTLFIHAYQSELFNKMVANYPSEKVPLIGFGTEDDVSHILKEEGIDKRDFIIRSIPEISSEGTYRDKYVTVENLEIEKIEEKTYKIHFSLQKGAYATVVIDELFI